MPTDAQPLGTGLRWGNIGATDPEVKRRERAAVRARIDAEWRARQAFWAAFRAEHCSGQVFKHTA